MSASTRSKPPPLKPSAEALRRAREWVERLLTHGEYWHSEPATTAKAETPANAKNTDMIRA